MSNPHIKNLIIKDKIKQLYTLSLDNNAIASTFKLIRELQDYIDIEYFENFIIGLANPIYIYRFAKDIVKSNKAKLQQAAICSSNLEVISYFACFVPGCDYRELEDVIITNKHSRMSYFLLRYGKDPDIQRLKEILINSGKPRYLYAIAKLQNSKEEFAQIEDLLLKTNSLLYIRMFAANIPGANIDKCVDRVLRTHDIDEIKKFSRHIKNERIDKYLLLV